MPICPSNSKTWSSSFQWAADHKGTPYFIATESGDSRTPISVLKSRGSGRVQSPTTRNWSGTSTGAASAAVTTILPAYWPGLASRGTLAVTQIGWKATL